MASIFLDTVFSIQHRLIPAHQNYEDVNWESEIFYDEWSGIFEPSLSIRCLKRNRFAVVMNFQGVFSTKIKKNRRNFGFPLLGGNERIYKHPFHHPVCLALECNSS